MRMILYNQSVICRAIIALFEAPTVEGWQSAAFRGQGQQSYLPNPQGIHSRLLAQSGRNEPARVACVDGEERLMFGLRTDFMKVYWAETRGCVLTSANLSTNALGAGNLKEVGILIGSDEIDIDRLLSSLEKK